MAMGSRVAGSLPMPGDLSGRSSAEALLLTSRGQSAARDQVVEVAVPVYNEEEVLEKSIRRLHRYLSASLPFPFVLTIADNASTDRTFAIAERISRELPGVGVVHLDRKGRGRALRYVWGRSDAAVVAYMDADLSTGLDAFLPLIAPLLSGHGDLATGNRLAAGSKVTRGLKREVISRAYNLLLRVVLSARFSDAQCGFKAARTQVIRELLSDVKDDAWFFDTELLMLAQRRGLRIHEVPVTWVEGAHSSVKIVRTALADLRGVARLGLPRSSRGTGRRGTRATGRPASPEPARCQLTGQEPTAVPEQRR